MEFKELEIPGVWLIKPQRFGDKRGYFAETFKTIEFKAATGLDINFVQDNESFSTGGVLRGLHMQRGKFAQAKLVRVSRGTVFDVAVDMRPQSPTLGKWVGAELSQENGLQLFIPRGFAHGFIVLSPEAQFQYKVDNIYAPQSEVCLRYDDPTVNVLWPNTEFPLILSPKDLKGLQFKDVLDTM